MTADCKKIVVRTRWCSGGAAARDLVAEVQQPMNLPAACKLEMVTAKTSKSGNPAPLAPPCTERLSFCNQLYGNGTHTHPWVPANVWYPWYHPQVTGTHA